MSAEDLTCFEPCHCRADGPEPECPECDGTGWTPPPSAAQAAELERIAGRLEEIRARAREVARNRMQQSPEVRRELARAAVESAWRRAHRWRSIDYLRAGALVLLAFLAGVNGETLASVSFGIGAFGFVLVAELSNR